MFSELPYDTESADIRLQLYRRIPRFLQPLITLICAKPYLGQPATAWSGTIHVVQSFLTTATGVLVSLAAWSESAPWLLPLSWILTVSGIRKLQVVIMHHCSHDAVFTSRWANFVLGEFISVLLIIKAFWRYRKDHLDHHNSKKLLTHVDETIQFLFGYSNLNVGLTKGTLWRRLLISLVSPFFHARWLLDRLASCFCSLNFYHNLIAVAFWSLILWQVARFDAWVPFLVAWVIPLTLLYNISATLRLAGEHRFPSDQESLRQRNLQFVCQSTVAIFLASAPPKKGDVLGWLPWCVRMMGHTLARVFVLVGDTPCHDFHHRHVRSRDWTNYIFARQRDDELGCPRFPERYSEEWGLLKAIDCNLESMSRVRQIE